jgi:hypothetical protein
VTPARWAPVLLWVVPALWSSNYLIARASHGVIAPHALAMGRWALALALMLVWMRVLAQGQRPAQMPALAKMLVLAQTLAEVQLMLGTTPDQRKTFDR